MNLSAKPAFCSQNYLNNKPAAFWSLNKFPIKFPKGLIIRCQSFSSSDHGNNGNMVDASMTILRQRIEEVRMKDHQERLRYSSPSPPQSSTACLGQQKVIFNGWSYQSEGDEDQLLPHRRYWMEIVGLIGAPVGFVFLTGSLCIYLVSFVWSIFRQ